MSILAGRCSSFIAFSGKIFTIKARDPVYREVSADMARMDKKYLEAAYQVGRFFCSDVYAYYQDTYKGILGKVQVEAMDYIHLKGETGIMELASRLNISKQHASKIALKLEELGYAEKTKDPSDGRASIYRLTEEGLRFIREHIALSDEYFEKLISELTEEDRNDLRTSLIQASGILKRCQKD